MKILNIAAVVTFLGVGAFITYHLVQDSDEKHYCVTRMEVATIEDKLSFPGFIYPGKEIDVKPQISGVVESIFISVGDYVEKGDPLASITLVPNASEIEQLQSAVTMAEINMNAAKVVYEREIKLLREEYISHAEFEIAEKDYLAAKESHASALRQLNLREKGNTSANNIVRATTTGVVIDIPVKTGSSVVERSFYNPGTTIATLAGMDRFVFRGNVPESSICNLQAEMPVKLTIPAYGNESIQAKLTKISAKGEVQNGVVKFPVEAEFIMEDNAVTLRSGYSAIAEILLLRRDSVLSLPGKCVFYKGDTTFVRTLEDSGKTVLEKRVVLGLTDGERVEIRNGLDAEDAIILNYYD